MVTESHMPAKAGAYQTESLSSPKGASCQTKVS